jgi:cytochrome c
MFRRFRPHISLGSLAFCLTAPLVAAAWVGAWAEDAPVPSPERGHALAQRFCNGCHLVDDNASVTVPVGVPTFRAIANQPGQTGQRIMNVLIKPHPPMPDIHLSNNEIVDIISYLETLRTDKSSPPLLSPTEPSTKPAYPEHS